MPRRRHTERSTLVSRLYRLERIKARVRFHEHARSLISKTHMILLRRNVIRSRIVSALYERYISFVPIACRVKLRFLDIIRKMFLMFKYWFLRFLTFVSRYSDNEIWYHHRVLDEIIGLTTKYGALVLSDRRFIQLLNYIYTNPYRYFAYDYVLNQLSEEQRRDLILRVLSILMSGVYPRIRDIKMYEGLLALLKFLTTRYGDFPCKSSKNAVRITRHTMQYLQQTIGSGVIMLVRFCRVRDIEPDPYLHHMMPMDEAVLNIVLRKPKDAVLALVMYCGLRALGWDVDIEIMRDHIGRPIARLKLKYVFHLPHWSKRALAHALHQIETYYNIDHCSPFVLLTPSKIEFYRAQGIEPEKLFYYRRTWSRDYIKRRLLQRFY